MSYVQIQPSAPKVRLETVLPKSLIQFCAGKFEGQLAIKEPQYEWAAGSRVKLVNDSSFATISSSAFVQVLVDGRNI